MLAGRLFRQIEPMPLECIKHFPLAKKLLINFPLDYRLTIRLVV